MLSADGYAPGQFGSSYGSIPFDTSFRVVDLYQKEKGIKNMRFVVQRVSSASVEVEDSITGKIDKGFFVLIGVEEADDVKIADKMISKLIGLRIFSDSEGKTNLSVQDVGGDLLLVSQFTLYADCRKGNRPSFTRSGSAEHAEKLYDYIVESCRTALGADRVGTGIFGASMKCSLVNEGPFTIILDSAEVCR